MATNNGNNPTAPPPLSHLVAVGDVLQLWESHTGRTPDRHTVKKWIRRRGVATYGTPKRRLFDRAAILAALRQTFPEPQLVTVEEAFRIAGREYPHRRKTASA